MKIRTPEELQDAIDKEIGWRKKELIAIKANIQSARKFSKDTALRSGITLLYAHWEGAIKNISYFYLCYVSNLKIPYDKLKNNFLAISVQSELEEFSVTSKASLQTQIVDNIFSKYSNLNSEVFSEIAYSIGIDVSEYETSYALIDKVLLNMRNKVAHGEKLEVLSLDENRYNEIHDKIFSLIEQFAAHISNSATMKDYLKK